MLFEICCTVLEGHTVYLVLVCAVGYFIEINDKGEITLTPSGLLIAEKTLEKHNILTEMLVSLGVDRETAMEDACKMEHDISDKTWEAIKKHAKFLNK